jgi:hypothetical protein
VSYPVLSGAVVITTANRGIRFKEGATTATALIGTGTYYLRSGAVNITDLGFAIKSALDAATVSANQYTVTVTASIDPASPGFLMTITRTSGSDNFQILWADALTTFDSDLVGCSANTLDDALPKTSTLSCAATWVSNDILREREPFGDRVAEIARRSNGGVVGVSRSSHMVSWALGFAFIHEDRMLLRANATDENATLEAFVRRFGAGAAFELHEQAIASGTTLDTLSSTTRVATLHWSQDTLSSFAPRRIGPGVPLYDLDTVAHEQVT